MNSVDTDRFFDLGAEIHGRAQVQQEPRRNFAVFIVHPHVGRHGDAR